MKLDPRIRSLSDILTCFDTERAEQFIGQKGYFADYLCVLTDLSDRATGFLTAIRDNDYAFYQDEDGGYFRFFLPESSLKPIEKKYRPYTLEEFCDKFPIGRPINFRMRGGDEIGNFLLIGYWRKRSKDQENAYIYIGRGSYGLEELFENYEWQDPDTGEWEPFGVEVEG